MFLLVTQNTSTTTNQILINLVFLRVNVVICWNVRIRILLIVDLMGIDDFFTGIYETVGGIANFLKAVDVIVGNLIVI